MRVRSCLAVPLWGCVTHVGPWAAHKVEDESPHSAKPQRRWFRTRSAPRRRQRNGANARAGGFTPCITPPGRADGEARYAHQRRLPGLRRVRLGVAAPFSREPAGEVIGVGAPDANRAALADLPDTRGKASGGNLAPDPVRTHPDFARELFGAQPPLWLAHAQAVGRAAPLSSERTVRDQRSAAV